MNSSTNRYLIKNGRLIDPANKIDGEFDILIAGSKVESVGKGLKNNNAEVVDAKGKIVAPGLVDMHVHLREPGREDKETIETGTLAAIRGGITSVAAMPNLEPQAVDSAGMVKRVNDIAKAKARANVFVIGAITRNREGKELADIKGMKRHGAVAVSDDGASVQDERLLSAALKEAKKNSILVISHCDDRRISGQGVINEGFIATKLGLRGIPKSAEYEFVRRDIELAKKTGASLHIAHVSCKESCDIIRAAKRSHLAITAETAPHYFTLTEECCVTYDTNTKMNPPLRTKDDVAAIKKALADGVIDAIASDHAPHSLHDKDIEFDKAAFGIIGLETSLGLAAAELIGNKTLGWAGLIARMSSNPAKILGIKRGGLGKGATADIVIIDPDKEWIYEGASIASKSKNSPFIGWKLKGRVTEVFVNGTPHPPLSPKGRGEGEGKFLGASLCHT